jgi:hypothetical protein
MAAHLLVTMNRARTPGAPVWLRVDRESREVSVVRLPEPFRGATVAHGAVVEGEVLYGVLQAPESLVSIFHTGDYWLTAWDTKSLDYLGGNKLDLCVDVHSICYWDGALLAVSTGTDEVVRLELDGARVVGSQVAWRPETAAPREDRHHLNSIATDGRDLFVSGFGRREGSLWSTAKNGFVENVTKGERVEEGLQHPHSLAWLRGRMVCCESRTRSVRWSGCEPVRLGGYTRGLCVSEGTIWVGLSRGRLRSKSTGMLNNWGSPGGAGGRCGLVALDGDLRQKAFVDLTAYGDEVYEVVEVGDASGWPVWEEQEWRDAALAGVEAGMERLRIEHDRVTRGFEEALEAARVRMQGELDEANRVIRGLHEKLDEVSAWAMRTHTQVEERDRTILELMATLQGEANTGVRLPLSGNRAAGRGSEGGDDIQDAAVPDVISVAVQHPRA